MPSVELLWWAGCPSHPEALARLREELAAAGMDPSAVVLREIRSEAAAEAAGFAGSPTIRINGIDVVDPGDRPARLTCRVYRLRDGRVSAVPDRADIRDALSDNAAGNRNRNQGGSRQ